MKLFVIFLILVAFSACNQKTFDSKEALLKYLQDEENDYVQKKTVNGVDFSLMFKPTDLIVSQVLQSKSINNVDSLRSVYNKYIYFNLSMSINNQEILNVAPENRNEYGLMVTQFAFEMEKKIHLYTSNNDTIQLADYIYPRAYGISGRTSMMFVFLKNRALKEVDYLNFTVEDFGIQTGEVKFKIPYKTIEANLQIKF